MKPGEARELGVLTSALTLTTDAPFDLSLKSNFVIYQFYYLNEPYHLFFYGTNYRDDEPCSK